ncbi:lysylphosphatidylglycerol synthase transmembrane domain-containing protein [Desulfocurvus vexinensis]|uniref:lysylphosphatidylglycerol synthase transmembrane domain-containing protein n=1 Tax=Desulfocurvus vexinensis TaxID=399548 RepID=UPI0004B00E9F|nr:lysylphosphatidylglycerol synthase transmembrane domain-containing protein [Desulfocurvus vexinensis]
MPPAPKTATAPRGGLSARRMAMGLVSLSLLAGLAWMVDPAQALRRLATFPPGLLAVLAVLFALNLLLVSFRFWRIAAHFSIALPWGTALRANLGGHVAGLFFIPLVGQVAGRQALLRGAGVPPLVNTSIAAYEKILLAAASGTLALVGAFLLMEWDSAMHMVSELSLPQVALAGACGYGLSLLLGGGRFERGLLRSCLRWPKLIQVGETLGVTLLGQAVMISCFVLGFHTVAPQVALLDLFAASAVVSFAASLPLSVGGWGTRELAAVYCLGKLGVPAPDALAVSILIGLCSTAVLLATTPLLLRRGGAPAAAPEAAAQPPALMERTSSWLLGAVMAVAVFFQVHVVLAGTTTNLNLADPFALLALAALTLHCLAQRRLPAWRVPGFNAVLACALLVLGTGLLLGLREVGPTQWAGGRGMGALVLLGYCAGGALLVAHHGAHGLRRVVEILAAVACTIVVLQIVLRGLALYGFDLPRDSNFAGYAANRNAFSFQLLCVTGALLGYAAVHARATARAGRRSVLGLALGLLLGGLLLSGSRAGLGTAALLLAAAWAAGRLPVRTLLTAGAIALGLWVLAHPVASPDASRFLYALPGRIIEQPLTDAQLRSAAILEHARWSANWEALRLWTQAPVLGSGLGVFYAKSQALVGQAITVHSTPIWVLAEFGLAGMAVLLAGVALLGRHALRGWRGAAHARALGLVLLGFAVFCQVHEVLYQRIFWLLLGALLALPRAAEPHLPGADAPPPPAPQT